MLEPERNVLLNISHTSSTCNGDHVGLFMKTKSIQKKKRHKLPFLIFKSVRGVKHSQN